MYYNTYIARQKMPAVAVVPTDMLLDEQDYPKDNETIKQHNSRCERTFRKLQEHVKLIQNSDNPDALSASKTQKFVVTDAGADDWPGCNLVCSKCTARKDKGKGARCTNTCCIGLPICWQHSLQFFRVRAARTQLKAPARLNFHGLFACDTTLQSDDCVFRSGELILPYIAEAVTEDIIDHRYGAGDENVAPYAINIKKSTRAKGGYEDGACMRSMMALANTIVSKAGYARHHAQAEVGVNCQFDSIPLKAKKNRGKYIAVLRATTNIYNGDEILVDSKDYPLPDDLTKYINKGIKPSQNGCRTR